MFESLVVDMLDLDMGSQERIPTSCSIPSVLGNKGWKVQDVAQIWTPATLSYEQDWNEKLLERLGGRGICNRIWNNLKDSHLTGNNKRPCCYEVTNVSKRLKASPSDFESSHSPAMSHMRSSQKASCSNRPVATTQSNHIAPRKHRRLKKDDTNRKITQWLLSSNPSPSKDLTVPQPSTPATPEAQRKRRRHKRRKRASDNHTQQPPAHSLPSSPAVTNHSTASLHPQLSRTPTHCSRTPQASSSVADTSSHPPQDPPDRHSDHQLHSPGPTAAKKHRTSGRT